MGKNRFIPFGYKLDKGKIRILDHEADSVKLIFEKYAKEFSYNEIARILTDEKIGYSEGANIWNKNMVKRILENDIYIGDSTYPVILTATDYSKIEKIKECKKLLYKSQELPYLEIIKEKAICYECGNKYTRLNDQHRSEKWRCKTNGCAREVTPTDALIISAVIAITNAVIESPSLLETKDSYEPSLEVNKLNNEINRELDKRDFNHELLKNMMLACAAKKYDQCKTLMPIELTQTLMTNFHDRAPIDEFDPNLFDETVSKLIIEKTGRIHMQFINGATISYKQEIRKEQ